MLSDFYKEKKVLVTGHTGFKGSWLSVILVEMGAEVIGYSTCGKEEPRLFDMCGVEKDITHIKGDVRDYDHLLSVFDQYRPEIVIHLAAQPLVRESYVIPRETYETNVMGTVNLLECVRKTDSVRSVLNVTTDKVYLNHEFDRGYVETDELDGYDPYSNSKSCSELVTHSYKRSFFDNSDVAVSTARAGNVIGGGDFAEDRIIPDCIRAASASVPVVVRNPYSIRPYQYVLEPLFAYLMIAERQYADKSTSGYYNVGPDINDCIKTGELVDLFNSLWGEGASRLDQYDGGPHEAGFLMLDCTKFKETFGWHPRWNIRTAVAKTIDWTKKYKNEGDVRKCMIEQINEYGKME